MRQMDYIKEYVKNDAKYLIIIRTETYNYSVEHIMDMFDELQKDFHNLLEKDVNIVKYGGRYYKGTYGLEFIINTEPDVNKYVQISQAENVL
jgi:hypothetical protein